MNLDDHWSDWDLESNLFLLNGLCWQILHGFVEDRDATQGPGQACWASPRLTFSDIGKGHRVKEPYGYTHNYTNYTHITYHSYHDIYSGSRSCDIWKATSIKGNPMELEWFFGMEKTRRVMATKKQLQGCVDRCSVRSSQKEVPRLMKIWGVTVTCHQCTGFHGYLIGGGILGTYQQKP